MLLLSQSSVEMLEIVKRWFYQQNLRADTSSYISQNIPTTLHESIKHVQRYEDARRPTRRAPASTPAQPAHGGHSIRQDGRSAPRPSQDTVSSSHQVLLEKYVGRRAQVRFVLRIMPAQQVRSRATSRPPTPHQIPDADWTEISTDSMTKLPPAADGHDAVLAIVDRLIIRSHFVATRSDASTEQTA